MKGSLFAFTAASFALALTGALTGAPASVAGQPICAAHDDVASDLEKKCAVRIVLTGTPSTDLFKAWPGSAPSSGAPTDLSPKSL